MDVEHITPEEIRDVDAEIQVLLSRLDTLMMSYWLPGIDEDDKTEIENEVDVVCADLAKYGVDFEALSKHTTDYR